MKPSESASLVAMLMAAFPAATYSEQTIRVYEQMVLDLDFELAKRAIHALIATARFLPAVSEIRAAAVDVADGPRLLGVEAWGHVCDAIRRVGVYHDPVFSDPLTAECVELMGWQHLCKSPNDAADRARFVELYNGLGERERRGKVVGRIGGGATGALPAKLRDQMAAIGGKRGG
jgi:hypothetical protein